jgi:hypothetical protein
MSSFPPRSAGYSAESKKHLGRDNGTANCVERACAARCQPRLTTADAISVIVVIVRQKRFFLRPATKPDKDLTEEVGGLFLCGVRLNAFSNLLNNPPTSSARFDQTSSLIELACCIAITRQRDTAIGSALRLVINQADPVSRRWTRSTSL